MTDDGRWDLVVVGAGPAGAATALGALRADPRLRVLLLDRADFPRDKSCGDGIAPHVFDVLAPWASTTSRTAGPAAPAGARARRVAVARQMARPVWVIPREVFDARLVEHAVAAGAVLRRHRVAPSGRRPGRSCSTASSAAGSSSAPTARTRSSRGARLPTRPTGARDPRLRADAPTRRGRQVILYGDRRQPSYAWAFDRGDGLSNVGYGELLDDGPRPAQPRAAARAARGAAARPRRGRRRAGGAPPAALRLALATSPTARCSSPVTRPGWSTR